MTRVKSKESQSGIQKLIWVDPATLGSNPHNWKVHPEAQMAGVMASIEANGWVKPLVFNQTTKRLVDGHGRKDKAIKKGLKSVPVLVGNWSEEQELHILQTLDPLAGMYRTDSERLASLNALVTQSVSRFKSLQVDSRKALGRLQSTLESYTEGIQEGSVDPAPIRTSTARVRGTERDYGRLVESDDSNGQGSPIDSDTQIVEQVLKTNILFPSTNPYGIPDLNSDLLATSEMAPRMTYNRSEDSIGPSSYYCHSARPYKLRDPQEDSGGCLGFFTEDWRFEGTYDNPAETAEMIRDENWTCVLSPDFSAYLDWPFAMRLWNLYRSRWVSRYWQGLGIYILPTLQSGCLIRISDLTRYHQLSKSPYKGGDNILDVACATLPRSLEVFAVQCRTIKQQGGSFKEFGQWLANRIEYFTPKTVVVYGGQEHQSKFIGYLPKKGVEYVMLESFIGGRRRKIKEKSSG